MIKQKNITGKEQQWQRYHGSDLLEELNRGEKGGWSAVNWQNGMELARRESQGRDQM